jgi:hypothetical protein
VNASAISGPRAWLRKAECVRKSFALVNKSSDEFYDLVSSILRLLFIQIFKHVSFVQQSSRPWEFVHIQPWRTLHVVESLSQWCGGVAGA